MTSFLKIKAISSTLLQHRSEPTDLANQLILLHTAMLDIKSDLPWVRNLLLFPLMLILDSVHPSRSANWGGPEQPPVPAASSNRVIEATLTCLSLLLGAGKGEGLALGPGQATQEPSSTLGRVVGSEEDEFDECMELIQRLVPILSLLSPPSTASNRPPLSGLSDEAATLTLGCISIVLLSLPRSSHMASREGPFLPMMGFLISMMIQIGGASDRPTVKLASLKTLRAIITALKASDAHRNKGSSALAFFLPGLMGGLAKVLLGLEAPSSSSSVISSCAAAALTCLTQVLAGSLGDHHAMGLLLVDPSLDPRDSTSLKESLRMIKNFALKSSPTGSKKDDESAKASIPATPPIAPSASPSSSAQDKAPPSSRPSFVVDRTKGWMMESGSKVSPLLSRLLPPLASNQRASVRAAVASTATSLLRLPSVLIALGNQGQGVLLEIVLALAQDDSIQVSDPCSGIILQCASQLPPGAIPVDSQVPSLAPLSIAAASMLEDLVTQLPILVKKGEASGISISRKLSNAMLLSGSSQTCKILIQRPVVLIDQVLQGISKCLAFSQEGASTSSITANGGGTMLIIATGRGYEALAGIARTLGYSARREDWASGVDLNQRRRLIDALLPRIDRSVGSIPRETHWQLACASEVTLCSEVFFGACSSWLPRPYQNDSRAQDLSTLPPLESKQQMMAHDLLLTLLSSKVWGASVHTSASPDPHLRESSNEAIGGQEAARNALLSRCLVEALGTIARCLGTGLPGRNLRLMLMPLLERLADENATVRASAQASIASVCFHCGYPGGLRHLLSSNADWVVDAVCRQMRDLARHPRAPLLMSALLNGGFQGGVGPKGNFASPALLRLLAEPMGSAIRGLSISSRRMIAASGSSPAGGGQGVQGGQGYVLSFLRVLHQVATCARSEAREVDEETQAALTVLRDEWDRHEALNPSQDEGHIEGQPPLSPPPGPVGDDSNEDEDEGARSFFKDEGARSFFTSRLASKQKADPQGINGVDLEATEHAPLSQAATFCLGEDERQALEARLDRQHVSASLANDAFEAALPLIPSSSLHTSILALQVTLDCLLALSSSTRSIEVDTRVLEEVGGGPGEKRIEPVRQETHKVLPAVAILWPSLITGLKDPRLPVVEKTLEVMGAAVGVAGGDFLSNRFKTQALPALLALLLHGHSTMRTSDHPSLLELRGGEGMSFMLGLRGGEEPLAADAVMRVRVSVLDCLNSFASSPPSYTFVPIEPLRPDPLSSEPLGPSMDGGEMPPQGQGTSRAMQAMARDFASAALPYLYINKNDDKALGGGRGGMHIIHGEGGYSPGRVCCQAGPGSHKAHDARSCSALARRCGTKGALLRPRGYGWRVYEHGV